MRKGSNKQADAPMSVHDALAEDAAMVSSPVR